MVDSSQLVRITYVKSTIGCPERQKLTVRSLGLRRLGDSVIQPNNAAVLGMVRAVRHLVVMEPVPEAVAAPGDADSGFEEN